MCKCSSSWGTHTHTAIDFHGTLLLICAQCVCVCVFNEFIGHPKSSTYTNVYMYNTYINFVLMVISYQIIYAGCQIFGNHLWTEWNACLMQWFDACDELLKNVLVTPCKCTYWSNWMLFLLARTSNTI